jgi:formate dehydrogenase subunit gamma
VTLVLRPRASLRAVKDAFVWGQEDLGWLKAAPRYYFLADEGSMPPQGHMNTGQKMWWLIVVVFSAVAILTGIVMWFLQEIAPAAVFQWMVFAHDAAFIVMGEMLLVHIYLGAIHPLMNEAWGAITRGTVSEGYARSHHARWYEEQVKGKGK